MANLLVTLGFGSTGSPGSTLPAVLGMGPDLPPGIGEFRIDSLERPGDVVLRVRYTGVPNSTVGAISTRPAAASNYTLTSSAGVPAPAILTASAASDDPEVVDLHLSKKLGPGVYRISVASTVTGVGNVLLTGPNAVDFEITEVDTSGISGGAAGSDTEIGLRALWHPVYRGKRIWGAVISGLAAGISAIEDQAAKAIRQIFITTASGSYLETRAADTGIPKYIDVGMTDTAFRESVIAIKNNKLTQGAFLRMLESFYGPESVRAYTDSGLREPFVLAEGAWLTIGIDESAEVTWRATRSDYRILRRATSVEVGLSMTRALRAAGTSATAEAFTDPDTGARGVRIWSGRRGLGSSVRITGGTAVPAFTFPTDLFPVPVPAPALPTWTIAVDADGVQKWSPDSKDFFDLSGVQAGDFIVAAAPEFAPANRGSWAITGVHQTYPSGVLNQWVEVLNPEGVDEVIPQLYIGSLKVFRPTKRTTYDAVNHSIVDQRDTASRVSLGVTTTAVTRVMRNAAYVHPDNWVGIIDFFRSSGGSVLVEASAVHGMVPGDLFEVRGTSVGGVPVEAYGTPSTDWVEDEGAGSSGAVVTTQWHRGGTTSVTDPASLTSSSGDVWILGGALNNGFGAVVPVNQVAVFSATPRTPGIDGSVTYDYDWIRKTGTPWGVGPGVTEILIPALLGAVGAVGGYAGTPWSEAASTDILSGTTIMRRAVPDGAVLVKEQLSNSAGVLAGLRFTINLDANPVSGDSLTVSDGTTTRIYGFGTGGNVTVTIGSSAGITIANLTSAIQGDGPAAWTAVAPTSPLRTTVIYEKTVSVSKSGLRIWGSAGTAAVSYYVPFATSGWTAPDYSAETATALPTADPGSGRAGFHRSRPTVRDGEIWEVRYAGSLGPAGDFWKWNVGALTWDDGVGWFTTTTGPSLILGVADAAVFSTPTAGLVVTGGSDKLNRAVGNIQVGDGSGAYSAGSGLLEARMQHSATRIGSTATALIVGGRRPFNNIRRTTRSYNTWSFDEAFGATTYAGPVSVTAAGNARVAGKLGHGVQLTAPMVASAGAPQTALNDLLRPDGTNVYTISGWMTPGQGCVIKCGAAGWSAVADNTLFEFGVDPSDDKFYVTWDTSTSGARISKIVKSGVTATSVWGAAAAIQPRYHHFAIRRSAAEVFATVSVTVYVDGVVVAQDLVFPAASGASAIWRFGTLSDMIPAYTGCIDEVGVSSQYLSSTDIIDQFQDEVGVRDDNPGDSYASPVGRVLASCEIVNSAGASVLAGGMAFARYAHSVVQLPDGRILAIGGIGYPAGTDVPTSASQRELELRSVEVWDARSGLWERIQDTAAPHSKGGAAYIASLNRVYVWGGYTAPALEYLDLDTMRWAVSTAGPGPGPASGGGISHGVIVSGGDTTTVARKLSTETRHFSAEPVAAEATGGRGINGVWIAAPGTTGSTIVFQTPDHTPGSGLGGEFVRSAGITGNDLPGPFIWDPTSGSGITATTGVLAETMEEGRRYPDLKLGAGQALLFPDSPGFLVVARGYAEEVGPIPYLKRRDADTLEINAGFQWDHTVEPGVVVTLLETRGPYVPADASTAGSFYATASPAGRVAATDQLRKISAAGIDLNLEIRYPGDRGLGGEGRPTRGSYKLSDIVEVYAGDVSKEVEAARLGEEVL